jgi:hypothetical protein
MLLGCTAWILHYSGATGTPDAIGGLLLGIGLCAWVMGWRKL